MGERGTWQDSPCDPWPPGWAGAVTEGGTELGRCPWHSEPLCRLLGADHIFALIIQLGQSQVRQRLFPKSPIPHRALVALLVCKVTALSPTDSSALSSSDCAHPGPLTAFFSSVSSGSQEVLTSVQREQPCSRTCGCAQVELWKCRGCAHTVCEATTAFMGREGDSRDVLSDTHQRTSHC